jgi:hypothetical protein
LQHCVGANEGEGLGHFWDDGLSHHGTRRQFPFRPPEDPPCG